MATITLKGNSISTYGELPTKGSIAPSFTLTKNDLSDISSDQFKGKRVILNIFPSLDTAVCAMTVRRFNQEASTLDNCVVLCISKDLPFAQKRFCGAEGLNDVMTLSDFRTGEFGQTYGVTITDGPMAGLLSRAVVIINEQGQVIYTEQVPEITQEPDYEKAIKALK